MDLKYYRNFITITECKTLLAASEKTHITQPALSAQVKALENHYGALLFNRTGKSMELTEAGTILYHCAKRFMELEDATQKDIFHNTHGIKGTLRIGTTLSFPNPYIEKMLYGFHQSKPDILFDIYEANTDGLLNLLKSGLIEIAMLRFTGSSPTDMEVVYSFKEILNIKFKPDNPWRLTVKDHIDVSDLKGVPLAVSRGTNEFLRERCLKCGFEPEILSISSSRNQPIVWAKYGVAAAVVPSFTMPSNSYDGELCSCPLSGEEIVCTRTFSVMKGRKLSSVAQCFLDYCRDGGFVDPYSERFKTLRAK